MRGETIVARGSWMTAALLGVLLVAEGPAMSLAPGLTAPGTAGERLMSALSTQGASSCAKRGRDCTFDPCCTGAGYCRQTEDGDATCK